MAKYSESTLHEAENLVRQTLSMNDSVAAESGMLIETGARAEITLAKDTVTTRDFIAADNLIDEDTGLVVFNKGELVESGTTLKGDWILEDTEPVDEVFNLDDNGHITDVDPETKEEIDNGTANTESGKDRDIDGQINKDYDNVESWAFGFVSTAEDYALGFDEDDDMACLGHLYNSDRQNAIVLSAVNPLDSTLVAPAMAQYNNIDTFGVNLSQYRMTAIAANGNEFIGSFLINDNNTYVDVNEKINLMIMDVKNGLEAVGIHLDGDNSTITLVGSVDLRQHSNNSYDTLNVYDNLNTKRVEITPFSIPQRNSPDSGIDITKKYFSYVTSSKTAPKSYISYDYWKDWDGPFWYSWRYKYELRNFSVSSTTSVDLGYINAGSVIDLSKLDVHYYTDPYVVGNVYASNRGTGIQQITTFTYTLKKDGSPVSGYNKVSLLSNSNLSISGINTADVGLSIAGTFLDDYAVSTSANYSIEINIAETIYAYYVGGVEYTNYYYKINTGLSGNVTLSIAKDMTGANDVSNRKLTVGTNGLSFVGNNSRYFYAATDGYELKWDDASLMLDSSNGLRMNKLYKVVSTSTSFEKKYDIYICNYSSSGYNCFLPYANEFGVGRVLTVIAFRGMKLYAVGTDTIRVPLATSVAESNLIEFGESTVTGSFQMPKYNVQLISANGGWYIVSYV